MTYSIFDDYRSELALKLLPMTIPVVGIFDEPKHSVCVNSSWLALVVAGLDILDDTAAWDGSDDEVHAARNEIRELIAALSVNDFCSGSLPDTNDCYDFPSYAPFISYFPQNPFNEPNLIPSGYITTPFTKFTDLNLIGWLSTWFPDFTESLTGYQPNDIIVDLGAFPLFANWDDVINGFLPQITITVHGEGVAELHLLNYPLGGRASITVDEQPNIADIFLGILGNGVNVELERDIISLPIESDSTNIEEVEIVGAGEHQIYITFLPVLDDAAIPFKFGGGFRKVVLCGFDESGVIMGLEDIRLVGEIIEARELGLWSPKIDLSPLHTGFQNQITANDNDIAALQAVDTGQQNQITVNEADIQTLYLENDNQQTEIDSLALGQQQQQLTIDQSVADIDVNEVDIATNALDIVNEQLATTSLNNEVNDLWIESNSQNTRITTLENAPSSGGGSGAMKTSVYTFDLTTNADTVAWKELLIAQVNHQFTYPNALITCNFRVVSFSALNTVKVFAKMQIDGVDTMVQESLAGSLVGMFPIAHSASNLSTTVPTEISLHWMGDGDTARIVKNQVVVYTIVEYADIVVAPTNPRVTFDAGGDPYTDIGIVGAVSSGGNPDNCFAAQSLAQNDYMEIEVDVPLTWTHFEMSLFTSSGSNLGIQLFLDGVPKQNLAGYSLVNQWETQPHVVPTAEIGTWSVRVTASFGSVADLRIDNLRFYEI